MKTLGIIGGMSPASTATYYQQINHNINQVKGGNTTAPIVLYSVEFGEIVECQKTANWNKAGQILTKAAQSLQQIGAEGILIATNTMHKIASDVANNIDVPLLSVIDATAKAIQHHKKHKVALLGTEFVMSEDFYKQGLNQYGIETVVPTPQVQKDIHRIIFDELCRGKILPQSKNFYLETIAELTQQGIEGVILGCTEIGLLLQQQDCELPLFDTALLHAQMASDFILNNC